MFNSNNHVFMHLYNSPLYWLLIYRRLHFLDSDKCSWICSEAFAAMTITGAAISALAMAFCNSAFFLHLWTAINRYCSIAYPILYSSVFTNTFSYGCIVITVLCILSFRMTNFIGKPLSLNYFLIVIILSLQ